VENKLEMVDGCNNLELRQVARFTQPQEAQGYE
jgi:hypothetical protein